jgi:CheY-like chemotaxis protein
MEKLGYILLADDSENDVELALRALSGYKLANEIVILRDGAEVLDHLFRRGAYSQRDEVDPVLILLDINMPKVNGVEVLAKVKADPRLSFVPVVMLTSSRHGLDVDECYRLGANAYVVKPVDFEQFADAVKTIGRFWAVLNELPHGTSSKSERATVGTSS